jgi:hypothetical protein
MINPNSFTRTRTYRCPGRSSRPRRGAAAAKTAARAWCGCTAAQQGRLRRPLQHGALPPVLGRGGASPPPARRRSAASGWSGTTTIANSDSNSDSNSDYRWPPRHRLPLLRGAVDDGLYQNIHSGVCAVCGYNIAPPARLLRLVAAATAARAPSTSWPCWCVLCITSSMGLITKCGAAVHADGPAYGLSLCSRAGAQPSQWQALRALRAQVVASTTSNAVSQAATFLTDAPCPPCTSHGASIKTAVGSWWPAQAGRGAATAGCRAVSPGARRW